MSYRKEKFLSFEKSSLLSKVDYLEGLDKKETNALFHEILSEGIHGFCFSLYEEGQEPGDIIPKPQIRKECRFLPITVDGFARFLPPKATNWFLK